MNSSLPSAPPPPSLFPILPLHPSLSDFAQDKPSLWIPLEVLEHIIFDVFPSSDPSPFALEPTPPRGLFHLLLVSKGFSSLVLPRFLRSISIKDSRDWGALFDESVGFFRENGDEGEGRRALVKQVRLATDEQAMVPLNLSKIENDMVQGHDPLEDISYNYIIPFNSHAVRFPNLKRVIFPPPSPFPPRSTRAVELSSLVVALRPRTLMGMIKAGARKRTNLIEERMDYMGDQRRNFYRQLPWTGVASSLLLPSTFLLGSITPEAFAQDEILRVILRCNLTSIHIHATGSPARLDPTQFLTILASLSSRFKRRPYVLIGFDKEWRRCASQQLGFRSMVDSWEWELEDGSRVGLFSPLAQA